MKTTIKKYKKLVNTNVEQICASKMVYRKDCSNFQNLSLSFLRFTFVENTWTTFSQKECLIRTVSITWTVHFICNFQCFNESSQPIVPHFHPVSAISLLFDKKIKRSGVGSRRQDNFSPYAHSCFWLLTNCYLLKISHRTYTIVLWTSLASSTWSLPLHQKQDGYTIQHYYLNSSYKIHE